MTNQATIRRLSKSNNPLLMLPYFKSTPSAIDRKTELRPTGIALLFYNLKGKDQQRQRF